MQRIKKWLVAAILFLGLHPQLLHAQIPIFGSTCVTAGETDTYTCPTSYTSGWPVQWCVVGGTITGTGGTCQGVNSQSSVTITWGSSGGSVNVHVYSSSNPSGTANVGVYTALSAGTITSNSAQTVNYGVPPGEIDCSAASGGGCGGIVYNYQWQQSPDGSNWTDISGATGQNLSFTAGATQMMYYRRSVSGAYTPGYSNTAVVNIIYPLAGGTVTPPTQDVFTGGTTSTLTGSAATGGNCSTYTYQWMSSSNNVDFYPISNTTSEAINPYPVSYTPPAPLQTTYYRYMVTCSGIVAYSSSVAIVVHDHLSPGSATALSSNGFYGVDPGALTATASSGGICAGGYNYQWQYSTDNATWTDAGTGSLTYDPGALTTTTWFRFRTICGSETVYTNTVQIQVYPQLVCNAINPTQQIISYNTNPGTISVSPSGGDQQYTYVWYSDATGSFQPIANTNSASYAPGLLTASTHFYVVVSDGPLHVTSPTATVVVNPPPNFGMGTINPASIVIAPGTSPGTLTYVPLQTPACTDGIHYQWQSSSDNIAWTAISGAADATTYAPGNLNASLYYRVAIMCGLVTLGYSNFSQVTVGQANVNLNYIITRNISRPGIPDKATADGLTAVTDVQQSIQYFDGLGRSVQTVEKQASPSGKDIVVPQLYDVYGRESTHYLPYVSPSSDGIYKPYALQEQAIFNSVQYPDEQSYFGETVYEPSPLNRVVTSLPQGDSWVGAGRGVQTAYQLNTAADKILMWNIGGAVGSMPAATTVYPDGTLTKTINTDENNHRMIQYTDKEGHVVCKRVQSDDSTQISGTGWMTTYYVYDDLNNLRFVITPKCVQISFQGQTSANMDWLTASLQCYRYEYDERKRMIIKKVPGITIGETWMVYDARDRLVMTQDSIGRQKGYWLTTAYDGLNRPDSAGRLVDGHDRSYHQGLAGGSVSYPGTGSPGYMLFTRTYYDNYRWVPVPETTSVFATQYVGDQRYFVTGLNSAPIYAQPITPAPFNRGQITGVELNILEATNWNIFKINYFDDRGRLLQTIASNYQTGVDTTTLQYDFSGRVLRRLTTKSNPGGAIPLNIASSKMNYDGMGRPTSTWMQLDNAASDQLIDSMQYNELGQLRTKYLGNYLDSMVYDYNIRGWVSGINKNYIAGTANNYFGEELGYDKAASVAPDNYFFWLQYNGNIASTVWKSAGDGVNRKYQYLYDDADRLRAASFTQDTAAGTGWNQNRIDFTVDNIGYDDNGNLLAMFQKGFKLSGSTFIDQLYYDYKGIGNQLYQVRDFVNDSASKLGDFHYVGGGMDKARAIDYVYDGNGNLIVDSNKNMTIAYNHLNLPDTVHFPGKGSILYTYSADGTRLRKVVMDSISRHQTWTSYTEGFVYSHTDSLVPTHNFVDTIQFVQHEEGRARWNLHNYTDGTSAYHWEYDFFEKDHLGNTRIVLTQQRDTANYMCTMEPQYRQIEDALFTGIDNTVYPVLAWYPPEPHGPTPNTTISVVDGNSYQVGPAKLLKVMSGDTVNLGVDAFMTGGDTGAVTSSSWYVLNGLANGLVSMPGPSHGSYADLMSSSSTVAAAVSAFLLQNEPTPVGKPKAYLNWMLLDNQLKYVSSSGQSGAIPVTVLGLSSLGASVPVKHSGYLYIWVSNETHWVMFFDNLSIQHIQGPMLEENHYYPFGLAMAGICDKALRGRYVENKFRFNSGNELQSKEFSDGSGLELYANEYRQYDPQIGRFNQPDVLGELSYDISPYSFASCNPILRSDPLGLKDTVVNGEHGSTSAPLQEVVVTARRPSKSVGQPGLLESAIPVWGSARAAVDDFQNGRWGWGLFNSALAITDVFLVKSIVTGVGKIVAKSIYKSVAEQVIKVNTERITLATLRNLTRESLLNAVDNPALKKVIENLYRPGSKIGSGSTADLLRIAPDLGHLEKGGAYVTGLRNLINSGNLVGQDLDIANELMHDLIDAVSSYK